MKQDRIVISVGGGIASTLLLPLKAIEMWGRDRIDLIMARLPNEDPDVWRLVEAVERLTGLSVQMIGHDKTPMEIFREVGMLGNSRIDPCSRILKREAVAEYLKANYDPGTTILCVGITAHEETAIDRRVAIRANWEKQGWKVEFPLFNDASLTKARQIELCQSLVGFVPRLYAMGFSHNNCGGACVKAGHAQWARLLWYLPEVYAEWRDGESEFRRVRGSTATILRDRKTRGGKTDTTPLTLAQFEVRMKARWAAMLPGIDPFDGLEETQACMWCEAV